MMRKPKYPFQEPAEAALKTALAKTRQAQRAAAGIADVDPAVVIPDLLTGRVDEENSTRMNEIVSDIEAEFDAIYLPVPRQKYVQLAVDRVRLHGTKVRGTGRPMRGVLVTGPTGSGKTTAIQQYATYLSQSGNYPDGVIPVLYLRLRKKVTVMKLLRSILDKFGDRHARRRDEDELIAQVRNCIERAGVEIIIIDECQHLRNRSTDSFEVTDQLKTFLDDSIAPVVFLGTDDARAMFDENLQLAGRCAESIRLTPLDPADEGDVARLGKFLELLDGEMVRRNLTRARSGLNSPYNVACLHLASGGVIGQAYRTVRAALMIATSRNADFVESYDLSLAVDRWAVKNGICHSNPFRCADLRDDFCELAA